MRAERVLVVSLQKSGTHLIAELMKNLGYVVWGSISVGEEDDFPFDREARDLAASMVLSPLQRLGLRLVRFSSLYDRITEKALMLLAVSWAERLGTPWPSRHGYAHLHFLYRHPRLLGLSAHSIEDTPSKTCMITQELPLGRTDGLFIKHWNRTGKPAIIFNYRDPRDVKLSFINYLTGKTASGEHDGYAEYFVYEKILHALADDDERLMHAILDPGFPGHRDFEESLWMLKHPGVCKVSYEELVGASGGGSDEKQLAAVARVLEHLGIEEEPDKVSQGIYTSKSRTFHKGRIGKWRTAFKPEHHRAFNKRFSDLLKLYGYPLHEEDEEV